MYGSEVRKKNGQGLFLGVCLGTRKCNRSSRIYFIVGVREGEGYLGRYLITRNVTQSEG